MTDLATVRIASDQEWRVIREVYAETYPVRPLLNRIDELEAQVKQLRDMFQYMLDDPALGPQSARRLARDALTATAPKVPPDRSVDSG